MFFMDLKRKVNIFFKYVLIRPRRVINLFLIYLSKFLKLPKVLGFPFTAMIEPTNYCNLKCPLCPTGQGLIKRKAENLSFEDFKKIMDNLEDTIFHVRLWNWGEPLLNKDFVKMVKYAKSKKMFVNTSTNSFFLNEKIIKDLIDAKLDQLIVSLDGASEETYKKYRKKGSFSKVIKALKKAKELKEQRRIKYPEIKLQFIVMKHNEHEIKKVIKLAKEIGVDTLFFKTLGVMMPEMKKELKKYLPTNKKFRRYEMYDGKLNEIKLAGRVCDYLWEEVTINVDGSFVPCCRDVHGDYVFGNLKKQKLKELWNNKKIIEFRKRVLKNKNSIDMCKYCSGSNKEFFISEINLK